MATRNTQMYIQGAQAYKTSEGPSDDQLFRPKVEKKTVVKFMLRFVPPPESDDMAIVPSFYVRKQVHYLRRADGSSIIKNCRHNLGKREKCPYCDYRFSPQGKEDKSVSWAERYYANVYVENGPEMVGKVFLLEFGNQLMKKILAEVAPEPDDFTPNPTPYNILDPKTGKSFIYSIDKTGQYTNYDASKFATTGSPIAGDPKSADLIFSQAHSLVPRVVMEKDIETIEVAANCLKDFLNEVGNAPQSAKVSESNFDKSNVGVAGVLDSIPDDVTGTVGGKPTSDWLNS